MPKSENREYRRMGVLAVARDAQGADENQSGQGKSYRVKGYATTFNEPYELFEDLDGKKYFEQVDPAAFDGADLSDVILQYDHEGMVYARNRNGSLKLTVDDHGLLVEADLGLTQDSRKLYEAIETGLVDQMSFCFTIEDQKRDRETETWTITKIGKVYDVSAVSIPANPGTEISAARKKALDGEIQRERAERLAEEARQKRIRILKLRARIAEGRRHDGF